MAACSALRGSACRTTASVAAGAAAHDLRDPWRAHRRRPRLARRTRCGPGRPVALKAGNGRRNHLAWILVAGMRPRRRQSRDAASSRARKLSARLETIPKGALLAAGDSVAFPPGGCAYLHRQSRAGIRCLLEGGHPHRCRRSLAFIRPGLRLVREPDRMASFFRRQTPDALRPRHDPAGVIWWEKARLISQREDKAKPRVQQYKIFADMRLTLGVGAHVGDDPECD